MLSELWAALRRKPLYVLPAAAAILVATWAFWPRAESVETSRVVRGPLAVGFREEGRTRVLERFVVNAPVDGVVERIALEPGDAVSLGSPLAVLRPSRGALLDPVNRSQTQARLDALKSELASAQASLASTSEERRRTAAALARGSALAKGRLISQSDLDTLQSQAATADSALRAAQSRVRTLTVLRDGTRAALSLQGADVADALSLVLRAPIDGRVIRRHVESESPVRIGQPLLEIGDPRAIEVVVEVLTEDAVRLRRGADVLVSRWGGEPPLRGRVDVVEPGGFTKVSALGVEEQRTIVVVALTEGAARYSMLGDAYRVEAEFSVWRGEAVLQLPVAALFRDGVHWATYVVDGGRARLRRVEVGHVGESAAQVLAGLEEGAVVITYPGDEIRDGVRVTTRD
jgi:HlyD family secretion protein